MKIEIEQKSESAVFYFNIGVLESAEITDDNRLFINDYERKEEDWRETDHDKTRPENQQAPKKQLKTGFCTGDKLMPVLAASKCHDGKIFLRLYKNVNAYDTKGKKADWEGSYWQGRVYSKKL